MVAGRFDLQCRELVLGHGARADYPGRPVIGRFPRRRHVGAAPRDRDQHAVLVGGKPGHGQADPGTGRGRVQACRRACPRAPVAWSAARNAVAAGLPPMLATKPTTAAAMAATVAPSQRRPFLDCGGLTNRSTGPPIRRLSVGLPAVLRRVSQSRTGRRSSYSDRQAWQVRKCRRTPAAAPGSSAPTMYAPMSPRHPLHAWLIYISRLFTLVPLQDVLARGPSSLRSARRP